LANGKLVHMIATLHLVYKQLSPGAVGTLQSASYTHKYHRTTVPVSICNCLSRRTVRNRYASSLQRQQIP